MSIEVKNISKSYGDQKALDNISFSIKKGEIVGFLGPNGAGKSTLMKILTTYLAADEGTALVNEQDVNSNPKAVQLSIGYLPEHNPLYLDLYVREYLAFNADVYKVAKSRIEEVIQLTGLTDANAVIEISDVTGKKVMVLNPDGALSIDVSEKLQNGIYFVSYHSDNGNIVRKFVVNL